MSSGSGAAGTAGVTYQRLISPRSRAPIVLSDTDDDDHHHQSEEPIYAHRSHSHRRSFSNGNLLPLTSQLVSADDPSVALSPLSLVPTTRQEEQEQEVQGRPSPRPRPKSAIGISGSSSGRSVIASEEDRFCDYYPNGDYKNTIGPKHFPTEPGETDFFRGIASQTFARSRVR